MEGKTKDRQILTMNRLSIYELAQVLVEKNGLDRRDAEDFVAAIFNIVQRGLERDSVVKIKGLGTFKIIGVEARESVNVNTGERVVIESHEKVTFAPDAIMKELVNKPFSQFETVVINEGVEFDDMRGGDIAAETDAVAAEGVADMTSKKDEAPSSDNCPPLIETALDDIKKAVENMGVRDVHADGISVKEEAQEELADIPGNATDDVRMAIVDDVEDVQEETIAMADKNVSSPAVSLEGGVVSDGNANIVTDEVEGHNTHDGGKPIECANEELDDVAAEVEQKDQPFVGAPGGTTSVSVTEHVSSNQTSNSSVEDAVSSISSSAATPADYVVEEENLKPERSRRWIWALCVFIVILVPAAFFGGYFFAMRTLPMNGAASAELDSAVAVKPVVVRQDVATSQDTLTVEHDSLDMERHATVEQTESVKSNDLPEVVAKEQSSADKAPKTVREAGCVASTEEDVVDYRKYEKMDARVRTGAYRIIGTSEVKTVRAGETLERISRRTLGEGMECYIEVYNGLESDAKLKEGQKIKIPKLVLKKAAARK
ncbi:MAG: HU family DNA-binding protein [Prevotella sp.]|nr:HU family DNA-binding protein [Prevotella sp.]